MQGQINKIISLGWYYRELNSYIEKNGILWTSQSCLVYRAAFCLAIGDLLQVNLERKGMLLCLRFIMSQL